VRTHGRLPPPLIDSPTFVLMQAGRLAMQWAAEALELFELEIAGFATLAVIQRLGPMTQAALADRLGVSHTTMSRVASGLVDAGLAVREYDYFDARHRRLCITGPGAELVAAAADELAEVESELPREVTEALATLPPENLGPIVETVRLLDSG
jgi:DNA-binding MarR family transcriptional regulator